MTASRRIGETKQRESSSATAPVGQMGRECQCASAKSPRANTIPHCQMSRPPPLACDGARSSWSLGQSISRPDYWQRRQQRVQADDTLDRDKTSDHSSGRGDKMTIDKCRRKHNSVARSPAIVMFAILAQFISINQQIATSNALQTNQPQLQTQHQLNKQQPHQWRNQSSVSDLINQARGQQVEKSSQKQATTMTSDVSQRLNTQAPGQQPALVSPSEVTARGQGAAPASDNEFELSDTANESSTPAMADEEPEETGTDESDSGTSEDQSADASDQPPGPGSQTPQIDRRHDDRQEAQPSVDTFEGIQLRPSRQSHGAGSEPNGAATLTTLRTMSQPETTPALPVRSSPIPPTSRPSISQLSASFDVNMGADRMLIKPVDELEARLLLSSSPSPLPPLLRPTTESGPTEQAPPRQAHNFDGQMDGSGGSPHELATESVIHNHRELSPNEFDGRGAAPTQSNATAHQRNPQQNDNQQQLVLMANGGRLNTNFNQQQFIGDSQPQHELAVTSICYTPFSLLLVILATILITLLISLGAYHLFKYLKRHQFDLVANSKHFDHKHLSTSSNGYSQGAAAATGHSLASAHSYLRPPAVHLTQAPLGGANATSACTLHLFQADECCQKCRTVGEKQARMVSDVSSYAFRNPYFTDDQQQLQTAGSGNRPAEGATSADQRMWPMELAASVRGSPTSSPAGYFGAGGSPSGFLAPTASSSEQMHFIESHIADLHNRQVTSSVKELSSFGADTTTTQVVDLTSKEQQDRVRAHPKEGDLVAIDLTGHDIIGLGFDVCGNQRDGIFVRSVSSHGPARESGCIQPGDRIKCINVSFDSVTPQDACDILNAAAPYKLRLLIEKKIATMSELDKMQHSNNRPTWNPAAEQRRRRPMMMMQANNAMGQQPLSAPDLSHRSGPLEATRNHLGRWLGLLTGGNHSEETRFANRLAVGHRQQVDDDFQLHNQRVMTTANNPLLMMSQYKQALPASSGAHNLYKLSPIGALAVGGVEENFRPTNSSASSVRDHQRPTSNAPVEGTNGTASNRFKHGNETPPKEEQRKSGALDDNQLGNTTESDLPKSRRATSQPDQDQNRQKARPQDDNCHLNGAFRGDEEEGTSSSRYFDGDDRDDYDVGDAVHGVDKYLHGHDSSDMENVVRLHDEDYDNVGDRLRQRHERTDHELDAEGRQSKLMASGKKFNAKSRLTM